MIDIITAGGRADPPRRAARCIGLCPRASVLLVAGGPALQTAAISVGLPFALVMLLMIMSSQKALSSSVAKLDASVLNR